MKPERLCIICLWCPAIARDRCRTCYQYLYRHGVDRPEHLIVAHSIQLLEKMLA